MLDGLRKKRTVITQRLQLERRVLELRAARERRVAALVRDHLASAPDLEGVAIETQNARGGVLFSKQQIADIDIDIAQHRLALEAEEHALEKDELQAEMELEETSALAALASVRAPESGWVESLLVSPGQVVSSGSTLARVVPDGALTRAVVFVSADDAAFLRPGLEARMEFPSLPPSEFGRVRASVTRVSNDVALAPEVAEVLR